jgi:hypothetical protein
MVNNAADAVPTPDPLETGAEAGPAVTPASAQDLPAHATQVSNQVFGVLSHGGAPDARYYKTRLLEGGDWKANVRAVFGELHVQREAAAHGARAPLSAEANALYMLCAIVQGEDQSYGAGVAQDLTTAAEKGGLQGSVADYLLGRYYSSAAGKAHGPERMTLNRLSLHHWGKVETFRVPGAAILLPGARSEFPGDMVDDRMTLPAGADAPAHGTTRPERYLAAGRVALAADELLLGNDEAALAETELSLGHVASWYAQNGTQDKPFGMLNIEACRMGALAVQAVALRTSAPERHAVRDRIVALTGNVLGQKDAVVQPVKRHEWAAYLAAGEAVVAPPVDQPALLTRMLGHMAATLRIRPAAASIFRIDGTYQLARTLSRDHAVEFDRLLAEADKTGK